MTDWKVWCGCLSVGSEQERCCITVSTSVYAGGRWLGHEYVKRRRVDVSSSTTCRSRPSA